MQYVLCDIIVTLKSSWWLLMSWCQFGTRTSATIMMTLSIQCTSRVTHCDEMYFDQASALYIDSLDSLDSLDSNKIIHQNTKFGKKSRTGSVNRVKQGKSEGFESCDRPIVRKRPIWVKIGDVLSRVTLKFDGCAWKNNRASLLCCFKLCATFHSHRWIKTGVTVRKRPIWVKFDDF